MPKKLVDELGWAPTQVGLIDDLERGGYAVT
jgi:hypothetical protein